MASTQLWTALTDALWSDLNLNFCKQHADPIANSADRGVRVYQETVLPTVAGQSGQNTVFLAWFSWSFFWIWAAFVGSVLSWIRVKLCDF
jgi:hypothetical protein